MRLEAERYRVDDAVGNNGHIDMVSVGLIYRFGQKAPTPAPLVMAVAPLPTPMPPSDKVAAMPPPPPPATPVAPVTAPRFEKYSISATELFAFDSAELKMAQPKLDEIASTLSSHADVRDVDITGYTDRIGSLAYNQKLAERRAVAVKNYLTSKGVAGSRLNAQGKGESDPVVVCTDKKLAALIQCCLLYTPRCV